MANGIKIGNLDISSFKVGSDDCKVYLGDILLYPSTHDYSQDYLTFDIKNSGNIKYNSCVGSFNYSKDDGKTWATGTSSTTISVLEGERILWKSRSVPTPVSNKGIGSFSGDTSLRFDVEGNPMSLLFRDNFKGVTSISGKNYAFYGLFDSCTNVVSAENLSLPATTLADHCYQLMFYKCTSLITAPQLPATTLTKYCYNSMFSYCTSLITAPQLPATTLANYCYSYMFQHNTKLNSITCLATDKSATNCTNSWVSNVASSGTFTKASNMSGWGRGYNGIPNGWTVQDYNG